MPAYLYENIRKIPANLTCGDLMDMRNYLNDMVNCCRNISIEQKQVIGGAIFANFERKILRAVNSYLETMDSHSDNIANNPESDKHLTNTTNSPWSASPQIPPITHNVNEFGHTPKRNSTSKTKHLLTYKAEADIKALRNLSRMFSEWVKSEKISHSVRNIYFPYKDTLMSINQNDSRVYINFYSSRGSSIIEKYSFPFNKLSESEEERFWNIYSRRVTKTIAKIIRDINNNPNNWMYMEVKRGALD